jgi:Flp pilus assembly protein CpaB
MTLTYRLRNVLIALVFATIAVTITFLYAASYRKHVNSQGQTVHVLVAARDIPVGTPSASLLADGFAKLAPIPRSAEVPDAVAGVTALRGLAVSQQIDAGEQVSARRFAATAAKGIQADLSGSLRAVEIAGAEQQVLSGTLEAGERVDFVASLAVPEGGQVHETRIIARNLLVLTAPSPSSSAKITAPGQEAIPVVLAMTDSQARAVYHVVAYGNWWLMLRPVTKPTNGGDTVDSSASIMSAGAKTGTGR